MRCCAYRLFGGCQRAVGAAGAAGGLARRSAGGRWSADDDKCDDGSGGDAIDDDYGLMPWGGIIGGELQKRIPEVVQTFQRRYN